MKSSLALLKHDLKKLKNPAQAKNLQWFFKTGKGEYGEGDKFFGIPVPKQREVAKKYFNLPIKDISKLIKSPIHEERLVSLLILVEKFKIAGEKDKKLIYRFYLKHSRYINNWDLVDLSAHKIVGAYLEKKNKGILIKLAKSKNLWQRRIAVLATFYYINNKDSKESLKIAKLLLKDSHDLIHKAVGWMLREVGKRCGQKTEEKFLKKHYKQMPRTMLRYAIERFPESLRKQYLYGK